MLHLLESTIQVIYFEYSHTENVLLMKTNTVYSYVQKQSFNQFIDFKKIRW